MQAAQVNLAWRNRLEENRLAFAGQIGEVAEIIDDLSGELKDREDSSGQLAGTLVQKLEKQKLKIKKISVTEESSHSHRQRIYMMVRVSQGRCITAKELAEWISKAAGRRFIPETGGPSVVRRKYGIMESALAGQFGDTRLLIQEKSTRNCSKQWWRGKRGLFLQKMSSEENLALVSRTSNWISRCISELSHAV